MTRTQELHDKIVSGTATMEEIEEYVGPDLINAGVHRLRGESDSRYAFLNWYEAVIEPIGLDKVAAWRMFSGQDTIDEFAASLTNEEADRFVEMFPDLQSAYQAKLDAGLGA